MDETAGGESSLEVERSAGTAIRNACRASQSSERNSSRVKTISVFVKIDKCKNKSGLVMAGGHSAWFVAEPIQEIDGMAPLEFRAREVVEEQCLEGVVLPLVD